MQKADGVIGIGPATWNATHSGTAITWRDVHISGNPGAYFRFVPNRAAVAFENNDEAYVLRLHQGDIRRGPGSGDLIPSPDGRVFVTPGPGRSGLRFYNDSEVFE